jgi:hypothetical protein
MAISPSQRWSSVVQDLFACVRGRLPAAFLERKLAEFGLAEVRPLPREDLPRFERVVDLVNSLIAGKSAPSGLKSEAAIVEAFPDDHPTLGKLRPLALEYLASMRPAKAGKGNRAVDPAPAASERGERPGRGRGDRPARGRGERPPPRRDERPAPRRDERPRPQPEKPRPAPPPRPPRITWEQWLERHLGPTAALAAAPSTAAAPATAVAPASTSALASVVEGAAAAPVPAAEPALATAPVPAVDAVAVVSAPAAVASAPVLEPTVPHALAKWEIGPEVKRQLGRIRDRIADVIAAKAEPTPALRELAFAILRPPLTVRDDLRCMIVEYLQRQGVTATVSSLYPPPAVAVLKRDWENLLAALGPLDPAVDAAWRKLVEAHPEVRAKLEAERAQELEDLVHRFSAALREHGETDPRTSELRGRLESRHAAAAERIAVELTRVNAAAEATANIGRLVAERGWEDAEVVAAIALLDGLDPGARQRLGAQRRHELDELDRRLRSASREQGPDGEATQTALKHLLARFPAEGAAAAARLDRIRRGENLEQQERALREAGRSLSAVHLATVEHRLSRLRPAPRWRLVVASAPDRPAQPVAEDRDGKAAAPAQPAQPARKGRGAKDAKDTKDAKEVRERRGGLAVGWLIAGECAHGPVAAGWRAADSGSLDEIDACVQAVVDREGGVIGLALADCAERGGGAWADAAWTLTAFAALVLPVESTCELVVELPAWAEASDPGLGAALVALGQAASAPGRNLTVSLALPAADHAASLAEAVAWSWGGRKDADAARIRQSGLADGCLLQPSVALREAVAQLGVGAKLAWPAWSALLADATTEPEGLAAALLAQFRARMAAASESVAALHRHLAGQARGRITEPARLVRELAWLDGLDAGLRPRDGLRHAGAVVAAQAAAGRIDPAAVTRLSTCLAELREDWPAEVLEAALHAAANAREALDPETAEALLAPWARAEAIACGGRLLLVRLGEERARIAASAGRWKDARRHLDRSAEAAARLVDTAEREVAVSRLAALRVAVLADDPAVADEEARAALAALLGGVDPATAAACLAVEGVPPHIHSALLRWAVCRNDEGVAAAYLKARSNWCDPREAAGTVLALRAVLLAPTEAVASRDLLTEAAERSGGDLAPAAQRLSLLACAVAAALHGAAVSDLRDRLTALRRDRPATAPAVAALERALALAPDVRAGLAEALPLLAR